MVILQLSPTIIELALIVAVLLYQFDWRYVATVLVTVALYMCFTYVATEWRIGIRRKMNESDTDANTKAIDSLLNYETVKYFSAEARESARYDRSMARYEEASVQAYTSLAVLNAGQAAIFTAGLTVTMVMCAFGIANGTHTIGDFVMINAMMIQLYQPLNFMGMVYREIKQAVIDIESMFALLGRPQEIKDAPDAKPLDVVHGAIRFEDVSFAYDPQRPILKGVSFEVPAGKTVAVVGPLRRRQVDRVAAPVSLLRRHLGSHPDRRPGHSRRDARFAAQPHRHGPAGHRAVQRHDPIQHPLRPLGSERRRSRGGRPGSPRSMPSYGCRRRATRPRSANARLKLSGGREAAGRHRPHHPEGGRPSSCSTRRPRPSTAIPRRKSRTPSSGWPRTAPRS